MKGGEEYRGDERRSGGGGYDRESGSGGGKRDGDKAREERLAQMDKEKSGVAVPKAAPRSANSSAAAL